MWWRIRFVYWVARHIHYREVNWKIDPVQNEIRCLRCLRHFKP